MTTYATDHPAHGPSDWVDPAHRVPSIDTKPDALFDVQGPLATYYEAMKYADIIWARVTAWRYHVPAAMPHHPLDVARAEQACGSHYARYAVALEAARLAREGWEPENPLLPLARKIAADVAAKLGRCPAQTVQDIARGLRDDKAYVQVVLAALTHAQQDEGKPT